jgi:hypothetical protein
MDKEKMIHLVAQLILEASRNGMEYDWMYQPHNTLDPLCEALNISFEEIQDIVGGYK